AGPGDGPACVLSSDRPAGSGPDPDPDHGPPGGCRGGCRPAAPLSCARSLQWVPSARPSRLKVVCLVLRAHLAPGDIEQAVVQDVRGEGRRVLATAGAAGVDERLD